MSKIRHTTPRQRKLIIDQFCNLIDQIYLIEKLTPIEANNRLNKDVLKSEKYNFLNTSDISLLSGYITAIQKYYNKIIK